MRQQEFRIESNHPVVHRLMPHMPVQYWFSDPSRAVAVAAKCVPNPFGDEVRVVHVPTGEVIFRCIDDDSSFAPLLDD